MSKQLKEKQMKSFTREITAAKVVPWMNIYTGIKQWGVDVKVNNKWSHLCEGDKPCIYDTEREAAKKIKELYFGTPS